MQFHLNGFKPGDPDIREPLETDQALSSTTEGIEQVDVLIVGCGPAGLTLAAQLASFSSIKTKIIDQKSGPLLVGQADGIACRTVEMFEAFGFSEKVLKEAYWVSETSFWKPDIGDSENIVRTNKIQDTEDGLSEFPHVILNQARVHDFFLDRMGKSSNRLTPDYSRRLREFTINDEITDYRVTATLECLEPEREGKSETVRARYIVGCDGARSQVRNCLGLEMVGDWANQAWGVMDVLAVTNFPDIRLKAVIQSAREGSMLIIPREGGYMVRFYIELSKLNKDERVKGKNITPDDLIAAARRILHPYELDVKEIAWWSVYEIGQRLCDKFDDVAAKGVNSQNPCAFIAGDACHTHSPKAGQGMNVSMGDSFNLGWKLAAVLEGRADAKLLHTYSAERQGVAKELIDFDREFAKMFSSSKKDGEDGGDAADASKLEAYFIKHGRFTAGTAIQYHSSIICGEPVYQHLAKGYEIGTRFHSAPVIRAADAKPMHLGHCVRADGRWRMFIFADQDAPSEPQSAVQKLCEFLHYSSNSPVRKFTRNGQDIDRVIDVRAIFQQSHRDFVFSELPSLLLPKKGMHSLIDYEKVFCSAIGNGKDIFDIRGIKRDEGCVVIVRPDQHIAHILPIAAYADITAFFEEFLR